MTKWTDEQQSFIDVCGKVPISLRAVAGAGKTSVLIAGVNSLTENHPFASVTCVAFNKSTADELRTRISAAVMCKTMNAIGHSAWSRSISLKPMDMKVSIHKTYDIARELWGKDFKFSEGLEDIPRLVALAKQSGIVVDDRGEGLVEDYLDHWKYLIFYFDLMIPEDYSLKAIRMARTLLEYSTTRSYEGIIDFNDQLYMPVCFGGSWFKSDRVLIDEAQDISTIQRHMLRHMLNSNGQLIAVGDPRQAIYGFRGAEADSMDQIRAEFGQAPMELTYTFRCSKAVTAEARLIVPDIKCPHEAPEGSVRHLEKWDLSLIPPDAAILCRNTRPLVDLAFRMISRRIKCYVLGRDIGANLIRLIDIMRADDLVDLIDRLDDYVITQVGIANSLGRPERAESVRDKVATINTCIDGLTDDTIKELKCSIESIFSDAKDGICLSTIHKAKGLEWDIVYFLDSDLIPSPYATHPWQFEQEENLRYVAITRAHIDLNYVYSHSVE